MLLAGWVETDHVGLTGPLWTVLGGPWILPHAAIAVALLLFRRSHPIVPTALMLIAVASGLIDAGVATYPALTVCVYACALYRSPRTRVIAAAMSAVVFGAVLAAEYGPAALAAENVVSAVGVVLVSVVPVVAVITAALLLGISVGNRRRSLAALLDRADQLARDRDQRARLAVVAERSRIARELHDVIAHSLSVMVRLSDGADAVAASDPERAQDAVRHIGRVGRESLVDMRRLLGVLHDEEDAAALAPQPSMAGMEALLDTARAAGLPVAAELADVRGLDAATQLVVFRVLQEGVTNALRYAVAPTRVLVRLQVGSVAEIEVADDGGSTGPRASVGAGRGLVGVRERAALYGGEVEAGPRSELGGRGWRLRVRLPLGTITEDGETA